MSASLEISMAEFNRAAEQCIQHSERTYPQFINSRALHVAKKAIEDTEKADATRIAYVLAGNVRTRIRVNRKTGQRKAVRQYDVAEDSFAAKIVNARRVKRGEKPIWGNELAKAARRMVGARIKAVAFIRSGWVYAVRTLGALVGGDRSAASATRMSGQPKGYARPARTAVNSAVTCEIANTALLQEKRSPMPVAVRGLASAIQRETREMLSHLAKKLQPVFSAVSAK